MKKDFNANYEVTKITKFIKKYYQENNLKGVVIGISGGKDSAVVAALFAKAIGPKNILGVTLPCHSKKMDRTDALKISDYYGFEMININITDTYDTFIKQIDLLGNFIDDYLINSNINLKPRLRMAALYYLAALYSKIKGGTYIVAGTGNKCEEYVGYFTKGGDSVSDIKVLADLTVTEVIKIGEVLNVPRDILYKTPSDGISGQSDEEKLGVTYLQIEKYLEGEKLDKDITDKIELLHKNSLHKFNIPTYIK